MKVLPLLLLAALLSGCLLSTDPIYTKDSIITDDRLIGTFEKEGTWIVSTHPTEPKHYKIRLTERNEWIELKGTLFTIGESTYLEIEKEKGNASKSGDPAGPSQIQFLSRLLSGEKHAVLGVRFEEDAITILGSDVFALRTFRDQFKPKEGRMLVNEAELTLTTGTKESREIVSEARKQHGLFNQPIILKKK